MAEKKLRIGVVGLGRGFTVMLPTLVFHPRTEVIAAVDTRAEARARFAEDFKGTAYESVDEMCNTSEIDAVYIATPHHLHSDNAISAAKAGKHILVEKPMALRTEDCTRMIEAAASNGVHLLVGHSHSYDAPIKLAKKIIDSGAYGPVRQITGLNYTDFIYRPRRADELNTTLGGGVVYSQAAHQIDIARLLAGGIIETIYAVTGNYDPNRPTEGIYSAILKFANGSVANLTFSGCGHFDSDEFCGWRGETGKLKNPKDYGLARQRLREITSGCSEETFKANSGYGGPLAKPFPENLPREISHEHFGLFVISCPGADIRPMPEVVKVYADEEVIEHDLDPPTVPRAEVFDELCEVVLDGDLPLHTGEWGRATFEACQAIIKSANDGCEVRLFHQVPTPIPNP